MTVFVVDADNANEQGKEASEQANVLANKMFKAVQDVIEDDTLSEVVLTAAGRMLSALICNAMDGEERSCHTACCAMHTLLHACVQEALSTKTMRPH